MKAVDFDYVRPTSIGEACARLAETGAEAKLLAGGQTLVPLLAMRLARPALLIDINLIEALQGIARSKAGVTIKSCTRQGDALADATLRRDLPLLAKALGFVGHVQTRNRGTIGGSLANADPAAEIGLAALTLDAVAVAASTQGARRIAMKDFFRAAMETALAPEECLTEIEFPAWREAGRIGTGFQEVSIRRADFALAAAAVQLSLDSGGICRRIVLSLGGAADVPLRVDATTEMLIGTKLAEDDIEATAQRVRDSIAPTDDLHASADYRRRIAGELAARAIAEARDEALGERA
ncbi:MAG TPA: FAD binding domain-containing protein [Stellaceae bacterium]|jgi:carbon-monoxide dehydrogenase medium subunit|nr:FAD binding domain-containing protein [Stellaceae bacterium]